MSTDTDTAGTPASDVPENRHGTGCSAFNRDGRSDTATAQHHYGVRLVRLDFGAGTAVQVALPVGAQILHGYLAHEAGLVLARPGERPVGKLVPMLVVLVDPTVAATEPRRFVAIPAGAGVSVATELRPVATFTSPDGAQVLVLFEEIGAVA